MRDADLHRDAPAGDLFAWRQMAPEAGYSIAVGQTNGR